VKYDIASRADIETLVKEFYSSLLEDDLVKHIFEQTILDQLEHHLETINQFWCSVLLGEQSYTGNVMLKHIALNQKVKLESIHFDRWLELWEKTIRQKHQGEKADDAIKRAHMMKELMLFKIRKSEGSGFIQ
jgi:hemoglobin